MTLQVYLGWDTRESLAYRVAKHSILKRASVPVRIDPVGILHLADRPVEVRDGNLWCPVSQAPMSTEFAISRFCVPFLVKTGWCLFADCDIVCLADIAELFALADDRYAVMCVKHQQEPLKDQSIQETKMDGQAQLYYWRKNWSSVVLWNCGHPANARLTEMMLTSWPGRDLHAFRWLKDDEIGELPNEWNWLVGVNPSVPEPKIVHYTLGGPWLSDWNQTLHDSIWLEEKTCLAPYA